MASAHGEAVEPWETSLFNICGLGSSATENMDEAPNEITCKEQGRAGVVRLTRVKELNALTLGMIRALEAFKHACAKNPHIYGIVQEAEGKGFCAGGDIRLIRDPGPGPAGGGGPLLCREYQHNWTLQCFRKPHVSLMNGITMGGGVGISLYGTHRVAGESISFAMPETGIGFTPDVGASWFLPRMPGKIGPYLALTGHVCHRADTYYLGVATHCIAAGKFEAIKAAMIEAEPIDPILDGLHEPPGESELERLREPVDRIFSASALEDVFRGLEREDGAWRDWAQETLGRLSKRSPLSLKVTFGLQKRGSAFMSLKEALTMEYRVATRMIRQHDFLEGVRAVIVDKDHSPNWQPAATGEVGSALVQSMFDPPPGDDLQLRDYSYSPRQVRTHFAEPSQANLPRISCTKVNKLLVRLIRGVLSSPAANGAGLPRGVLVRVFCAVSVVAIMPRCAPNKLTRKHRTIDACQTEWEKSSLR